MTPEEAIAAVRNRWARPPLDPRDVLERVAVRFEGACAEWSTAQHLRAVRLFRQVTGRHVSRYVHELDEVDSAIDALQGAR